MVVEGGCFVRLSRLGYLQLRGARGSRAMTRCRHAARVRSGYVRTRAACATVGTLSRFPVMPAARVLVCERNAKWAIGLRRVLGETGPRVFETRSWGECWQELDRSPASFLALELTPGGEETLLRRLLDLGQRFRRARAVVLAPRGHERLEWALREAGAVHVVFSPSDLPAVAGLLRWHLQQVPESERTLRQAVWGRLPWRGGASQTDRSQAEPGNEEGCTPTAFES
jgi:DNA-binding response OmpR family regulator